MTFSIIIAAYNVASYISRTIESCISQINIDKREYEVIVIDDGSKDDTGAIIDQYNSLSNLRIVHQPNGGLSRTRNVGIEMARGEFVLFLDGDDWFIPETLSLLKQKITNVDLVIFPMVYWYSRDENVVRHYGLHAGVIYTPSQFLKNTLGCQQLNIIPAPNKCYKRSILIENRQLFLEGILHEDNPYFADTVKNFKRITYIDIGLYVYRQLREGSITRTHTLRNFKGIVLGNEYILKKWGCANKYINYMVSCSNVFQVILKYDCREDVNEVMKHYRQFDVKWTAFKQLFKYPFIPKAIVRHILLLMDPWLLRMFCKLYYKK